jgi:hypothetical protein
MYVALLVWLCAHINVVANHVPEEPLEKPVNQEADAVDDAYVSKGKFHRTRFDHLRLCEVKVEP